MPKDAFVDYIVNELKRDKTALKNIILYCLLLLAENTPDPSLSIKKMTSMMANDSMNDRLNGVEYIDNRNFTDEFIALGTVSGNTQQQKAKAQTSHSHQVGS